MLLPSPNPWPLPFLSTAAAPASNLPRRITKLCSLSVDDLNWKFSLSRQRLPSFAPLPSTRFRRFLSVQALHPSLVKNPVSLPTDRRILFGSFNCNVQRSGSSRHRIVKLEAGRSKAKKGRGSGGRIEGPGRTKTQQQRGGSKDAGNKNNAPRNGQAQSGTQSGRSQESRQGAHGKAADPDIRHPDDYYKYGPYGPYAYKARVVGTPRKGTIATKQVVMFSPVKHEQEFEERAIREAIAVHDKRLREFNEGIGIQFFLAFVRQPRRVRYEVPWKQWTLVSQVSVESAEELDKWRLGFRIDQKMRNAITQCAAWFRPDLVYVKKPAYQVRFEPQREFLDELVKLLEPEAALEGSPGPHSSDGNHPYHERKTYYGGFCQLLGVDVDASEELVISTYEKLDEEGKLACLEHLLCNHPVQLLHPFPRWSGWPNRKKQRKVVESLESTLQAASNTGDEVDGDREGKKDSQAEYINDSEEEDEGWLDDDDSDEQEGDKEGNNWSEQDNFWENEDAREGDDDEWDERENQATEEDGRLLVDAFDGESDFVEERTADSPSSPEPRLKAAVRPFTYLNLVKEIVMLRHILVKQKLDV